MTISEAYSSYVTWLRDNEERTGEKPVTTFAEYLSNMGY